MSYNVQIPTRPHLSLHQVTILILSVYVLAALFVQTLIPINSETSVLLDRIDFIICLIFIYDFFLRLFRAPKKMAFLKWGWIDLVSSIPTFDLLRVGRLVRVVRILRILRAFRSTKILAHHLYWNRAKGTLATVALISFTLTIFSTIAILNLETEDGSNIKTAADALWWSIATITTVGYGDKFPITPEGRIVGAVLMIAGVGLFVTFTGYVANFFLEGEKEKDEGELGALAHEVRLLREKIEALEGKLTPDD